MENGNDSGFPRVEGYELLERLGHGGTAEVWKARQVSLDRPVALKILWKERLTEAGSREAFRREAVSAAKVDLGGVVRVLDFGETEEGRLWYAMELVEGESLADWLTGHGRMAAGEVLTLAGILAGTLGELWRKHGLVHCDIKPGNVLVGEDGGVKLADFGVARYAGTAGLRGDEDLEGTPSYLAPEQIESGRADCRSDMYSLGLTLYHAVTGRVPFDGRTLDEVLEAQQTDYLADPCELAPELTTGFDWLLAKLTAKDPGQRPDHWEAVEKDIAQLKAGHMPLPPYPKEGESTILLKPERTAGRRGKLSAGTRKTVVVVGAQTGEWMESHGEAEMRRRQGGGGGRGCMGFLLFALLAAGVAGGVWWKMGMPRFWEGGGKAAPAAGEGVGDVLEVHGAAGAATLKPEEEGEVEGAESTGTMGTADEDEGAWDRREFVEAADLFNGALAVWEGAEGLGEAEREDALAGIEADARLAAERFEGLAAEVPADVPAREYANQCYQLAKDARRARIPAEARRLAYAGKRHDEKRAAWPTPAGGFLGTPMQLGYAWDYQPTPEGREDAMEFMLLMTRMGVERGAASTMGDDALALHGGLKWMMPLREALKLARADGGARRHVAEGAIFPFGGVFYTDVEAGRWGMGKYGRMRLLSDAEDRLVGVQLYSEESGETGHAEGTYTEGLQTLDFVTGRRIPEKGDVRVFQQALTGPGTVRVDSEGADFSGGEDGARSIWRSELILARGLAECCLYHVLGGTEE